MECRRFNKKIRPGFFDTPIRATNILTGYSVFRSIADMVQKMIKYFSTYHRIKTILLFTLSTFISTIVFSQQKEEADNLVQETVVFQDKGDVDSAFSRYNLALKMDRDNLAALAEMLIAIYPLKNMMRPRSDCESLAKLP